MKLEDMKIGMTVAIVKPVELYPHGYFENGLLGTVVKVHDAEAGYDGRFLTDQVRAEVKLATKYEGLNEWDNCLLVYEREAECTPDHFEPLESAVEVENTGDLSVEYRLWCESHGYPNIAAEELVHELAHRESVLRDHIGWLVGFQRRWDQHLDLKASADKFWGWFERVKREAVETDIGKHFVAAGFNVTHTGGGCLAWEKNFANGRYMWICDEEQGLGLGEDTKDPAMICGLYDKEGDCISDVTMPDAASALRWAYTAANLVAVPRGTV